MLRYLLAITLTALVAAAPCSADENAPQPEALHYGALVSESGVPVAEIFVSTSDGGQISCSGVVIDKRTVLTAAHCVAAGDIAGLDVLVSGEYARGISYAVDPHYSPLSAFGSSRGDLAYITLDRKLPRGIHPVRLATRAPKAGEMLSLFGFGLDEYGGSGVLKFGAMQTVSYDGVIIAAVRAYGGTAVCSGDSGGPAFIVRKKKLYLAGLISYGDIDCDTTAGIASVVSPEARAFLKRAKRRPPARRDDR